MAPIFALVFEGNEWRTLFSKMHEALVDDFNSTAFATERD